MPTAPVLRSGAPDDAPAVARLAGDRAVADAKISVPHPLDAAGAAALLARYTAEEAAGAAQHFAVCWVAPDAPVGGMPDRVGLVEAPLVGAVSLRHLDAEHRQAELSCWIGRPWWGRGLASAAVAAAPDVAFAAPPVRSVGGATRARSKTPTAESDGGDTNRYCNSPTHASP